MAQSEFDRLKIILLLLIFIQISKSQIVNTTLGLVQGTSLVSRDGRTFNAFLGIPYAMAPKGNLRFMDPKPAIRWDGIRDATTYGSICPQYGDLVGPDVPQDEDCLNLNIYSAHVNSTRSKENLLPVLVYLHGGFFMVLSGSNYGPKYFMDHDVVFVTLNYRLGAFGFLSSEDESAPGNAGVKDQVMGLKWIQDNIVNFGGDRNRVSIYGESAGGSAVHYHLISEMSAGLFSAAISGSGTAFKVLSHQVSPFQNLEKLARELGCESQLGNTSEMVTCLRAIDASAIAENSDEFLKVLKDPSRLYSPSIERNGTSSEPFLTQHPYEIMASGLQNRVPWMIGVNSGEGFFLTQNIVSDDKWVQEINMNWTKGLARDFLLLNGSTDNENIISSIDKFYLSSEASNGSVDFKKDFLGFTDLFSDRYYIHASLHAAKIQGKESSVFLYYNDYVTSVNPTGQGPSHGEELALLFSPGNFSEPIIDENHPDYIQSKAMVDIWVQFVTDPHNVMYNNQIWKPVNVTETDMGCMIFRNSNRGEQGYAVLPETVKTRMKFWEELKVPPYQEYLQK